MRESAAALPLAALIAQHMESAYGMRGFVGLGKGMNILHRLIGMAAISTLAVLAGGRGKPF